MFIKKLTSQVICEPDYPVAETVQGKLRGLLVDGTFEFRGIKYADAKRFHSPEPVKPWEGIKDAIIHGFACPEIQTVIPQDNFNVPHVFYPQHEDCQYLNIWTQHLDKQAKHPVMVWLHGGGYATGSGIEHFAYDGENLSKAGDVVVVTLNHRLNILGHLDLSSFGDEYKNSVNLGLEDLVAALKWVNENIDAFGGDRDNVTIFGQSGGGGMVGCLLQTPAADGLYHRAIIQSGVIKDRNFESDDSFSVKVVRAIMERYGLKDVHELEALPYFRLAEVCRGMNAGMSWAPAPNDYYLGDIFTTPIREEAKKIPVMVGNVMGEFSGNYNNTVDDNRKNLWDDEKRLRLIKEAIPEKTDEVINAFRSTYPDKNIADVLFVDTMFRPGTLGYLDLRAEAGLTNTYSYMFALESPIYGGTVPWHNAEIPYVFKNADYLEPSYEPGVTEPLQEIVSKAWISFAVSGDPNSDLLGGWAPYTKDCPGTMIFDKKCRFASDYDRKLTELLAEVKRTTKRLDRSQAAKLFGGGPRI